jgi:hypothetical protein
MASSLYAIDAKWREHRSDSEAAAAREKNTTKHNAGKDTTGTDECRTTAGDPAPTPAPRRCPVIQPVSEKDCPADGTVYAFSCDHPDLKPPDVCRSNNGECFTNKKLDNCVYQGKDSADMYDVVNVRTSPERMWRDRDGQPYVFA